MRRFSWFWVALLMAGWPGTMLTRAQDRVSFHENIRPILQQRCQVCHAAEGGQGGLSLAGHQGLLKGGKSGPALIPGKPDQSLLLRQVEGSPPKMPMSGAPLTADQVALIRRWII